MSTEAIDPRIHARRLEVARAAARRRLRVTMAVASAVVVAGLAYLVVHSPLLDVDRVRVEGTRNLTADQVVAAAGVERGAPLLVLDTAAAERRVEDLVWVADARVERVFPGTVRVVVSERVVTAYVRRDAGTVVLLAADGRAVALAPEPPAGALEIVGVRRAPDVGELVSPPGAAGVVRDLPGVLAARVARVDVGGAGVTLLLADGPEVRLGDTGRAAEKGAAALAVMEDNADRPLAYVDVSDPAHAVVRPAGA